VTIAGEDAVASDAAVGEGTLSGFLASQMSSITNAAQIGAGQNIERPIFMVI
jgi:hypothetical protein